MFLLQCMMVQSAQWLITLALLLTLLSRSCCSVKWRLLLFSCSCHHFRRLCCCCCCTRERLPLITHCGKHTWLQSADELLSPLSHCSEPPSESMPVSAAQSHWRCLRFTATCLFYRPTTTKKKKTGGEYFRFNWWLKVPVTDTAAAEIP